VTLAVCPCAGGIKRCHRPFRSKGCFKRRGWRLANIPIRGRAKQVGVIIGRSKSSITSLRSADYRLVVSHPVLGRPRTAGPSPMYENRSGRPTRCIFAAFGFKLNRDGFNFAPTTWKRSLVRPFLAFHVRHCFVGRRRGAMFCGRRFLIPRICNA
jgi:hypothetical protein